MFNKSKLMIGVLMIAFLFVSIGPTGAQQKNPLQLINWNKPVPAVDRLTGDKYILPQGWKQATKGVKQITYFNSGAMRHDPATAKNIEIFEKRTGIKVNHIDVSSTILFQKTLNVLVSKDPSIHAMSLTDAPMELSQIIGGGWVEPLPFWTPEVQKAYPPALVEALQGPDGKFYATCDTMRGYLLFYRPSWLKAAGVEEVPTTWQGVRKAAKKAREWAKKNLGEDYYGIVFPGKYNLTHMIQAGIYSQGERVLRNGKPKFNTPAGKKSWKFWVDLVKDDIAPEAVLGYTWNDYQQAFARGKAAFMLGFTTYVNRLADPELSPGVHKNVYGKPAKGPRGTGDWAVVAPPKWSDEMPDEYRAAFVDFDGFVINKYADPAHKAAAMLFAEFRMSKEATANEVVVEGNESFYPGAYKDPDVMKQAAYTKVRRKAMKHTVMEAFPPGGKHAMDILIEYFGKAVTGELPTLEALNKAQSEIDKIYE